MVSLFKVEYKQLAYSFTVRHCISHSRVVCFQHKSSCYWHTKERCNQSTSGWSASDKLDWSRQSSTCTNVHWRRWTSFQWGQWPGATVIGSFGSLLQGRSVSTDDAFWESEKKKKVECWIPWEYSSSVILQWRIGLQQIEKRLTWLFSRTFIHMTLE